VPRKIVAARCRLFPSISDFFSRGRTWPIRGSRMYDDVQEDNNAEPKIVEVSYLAHVGTRADVGGT
jgi:hypothetical protein